VGRKPGLLLVEVHRDDVEADRRVAPQVDQDIEQRVAVLAARQAHHHPVAIFDHAVIGDRPAGEPAQALGQLVRLV